MRKSDKDDLVVEKKPVGKPRAFNSVEELHNAINDYFDTVSIIKEAVDYVKCGQEEVDGKMVDKFAQVPVLNGKGEQVTYRYYFDKPSIVGMCLHMGITRETLCNYEKRDGYFDTIKMAKQLIEKYLEDQLGKDQGQVTGIIFNLKNNFGWKDKIETELSGSVGISFEDQLSELVKDGEE